MTREAECTEISIGLGLEDLRVVHAGSFDLDAGRRDARLQRSSGQQHHGRPSRFSLSTLTAIPRLPPPSPRSMYVCPSFLALLLTENKRERERKRELSPFYPSPSLVVLYLSSLTSTRACHLRESTEILINSYCNKGSSLFHTIFLFNI